MGGLAQYNEYRGPMTREEYVFKHVSHVMRSPYAPRTRARDGSAPDEVPSLPASPVRESFQVAQRKGMTYPPAPPTSERSSRSPTPERSADPRSCIKGSREASRLNEMHARSDNRHNGSQRRVRFKLPRPRAQSAPVRRRDPPQYMYTAYGFSKPESYRSDGRGSVISNKPKKYRDKEEVTRAGHSERPKSKVQRAGDDSKRDKARHPFRPMGESRESFCARWCPWLVWF